MRILAQVFFFWKGWMSYRGNRIDERVAGLRNINATPLKKGGRRREEREDFWGTCSAPAVRGEIFKIRRAHSCFKKALENGAGLS